MAVKFIARRGVGYRPHLGDIVTMPLPTEWAPLMHPDGLPASGVPIKYVLGAPGANGMPAAAVPLPPGGIPGIYYHPGGFVPAGGANPGQNAGQNAQDAGIVTPGGNGNAWPRWQSNGGPGNGASTWPNGSVPAGGTPGLYYERGVFVPGDSAPLAPGGVRGVYYRPNAGVPGMPNGGFLPADIGIPGGPGAGTRALPPGGTAGVYYQPGTFIPYAGGSTPGDGGMLPAGGTPGAYYQPGQLVPGQTAGGLVIPPAVVSTPGPGSPLPGGWQPDRILPDWMLPPELQRSNPLVHRNLWRPNRWDYRLRYEALLWQWMATHGGLRSCCRVPDLGAPIWNQPPWQVMPSQGVEYRKMFSQPLAAISGGPPFDGTDTVLGSFNIPNGYDAVLNQFVCSFTGAGFDEFSGSIAWRVRIDNRFGKDLGNVTNTFGSYATAFLVPGYGIRMVSGQTVYLIANIPNGSPVNNGVVTAGVFGWWYPRR